MPKIVATGTHVLRVTIAPKIYRDIEIVSTKRLYDLARAIVRAFDFDLDHAFGFYSKLKGNLLDSPVSYELFTDMGQRNVGLSVKRTTVADAFPSIGHRMIFLYDYGREWHFQVKTIDLSRAAPGVKYPRLRKIVGEAPPQYVYPDDDDDDDQ